MIYGHGFSVGRGKRLLAVIVGFLLVLVIDPALASVRCIQSNLTELGYEPGPIDGQIGRNTLAALKLFADENPVDLPDYSKDNSAEWCLLVAAHADQDHQSGVKPEGFIDFFVYEKGRHCRPGVILKAPVHRSINRERKELVKALEWFKDSISIAKGKPERAAELARQLARLAASDAFTHIDWSGRGSSPVHWQTNLLKNVAFALNLVDHFSAWGPGQRLLVKSWGDTLWKNSHYSAWGRRQSDRWPDTVATAATAYIAWGIASQNEEALQEGMSDFAKVARQLTENRGTGAYYKGRLLRRLPEPDWGARIEDKTLGDLVLAAHLAKAINIDLFASRESDVSLYEAVVGWQETLFADGGTRVAGEDLSFLTTNGQERSWSWTEYFVVNFPDDERTTILRERSANIATRSSLGYTGLAMGPSTCLVRPNG